MNKAMIFFQYLAEVLLHKLGANNPNESSCCVISNSLSQHSLPSPRRSIEQDTSWWVNTNLFVKLVVGKW